MKKVFVYSVMMALCSPMIFAAQQTLTGRISDTMCGTGHSMMKTGHLEMTDKDCTLACIKAGQKYVLVSGGKVYQIENQTLAGLEAKAGNNVAVTGDVSADGKSIKIATLKAGTSVGASTGTTKKAAPKMDPKMKM